MAKGQTQDYHNPTSIPRRGSACPGQHNIKKKPNARKCVDLFTVTDGPARYAKPP